MLAARLSARAPLHVAAPRRKCRVPRHALRQNVLRNVWLRSQAPTASPYRAWMDACVRSVLWERATCERLGWRALAPNVGP